MRFFFVEIAVDFSGALARQILIERGKLELRKLSNVVRGTGIEPVHPFGYKILSLGRLPIPPPALAILFYQTWHAIHFESTL